MSLRKKRNYLHIANMAKNKTVLQTLGFAFGESEVSFASQCVFTTLPLGEDPFSPLMNFGRPAVSRVLLYMTGQDR